jgi:hypothetical protein
MQKLRGGAHHQSEKQPGKDTHNPSEFRNGNLV